jgi:K+-transporting ATPase ATPase C chain
MLMLRQSVIAFRMLLVLTVITGLAYPDIVTGLAESLYPEQSNGSLVRQNGKVIGSSLIAQNFTRPEYFHPRPSAVNYDAAASGASNLGPTSQVLVDRVKAEAAKFRAENPEFSGPIPSDLLTTSGSGLDPDISPASALAQVPRVAKARGADPKLVEDLMLALVEGRDLGLLGEPRVNVLELNLLLDQRFPTKK